MELLRPNCEVRQLQVQEVSRCIDQAGWNLFDVLLGRGCPMISRNMRAWGSQRISSTYWNRPFDGSKRLRIGGVFPIHQIFFQGSATVGKERRGKNGPSRCIKCPSEKKKEQKGKS
jgi:hypothetical protein